MTRSKGIKVLRLNVTVSQEAKKKIEMYAAKENRNISNMNNQMILQYRKRDKAE